MTTIEEPTLNAERTPYARLGGEAPVFALVDAFYDLMDTAPEFYGIRKLHPESLDGSRSKLKKFLSGWLGGPQLYVQEFGNPMLRARHLPFAIGVDDAGEEFFPGITRRQLADVLFFRCKLGVQLQGVLPVKGYGRGGSGGHEFP